MRIQSVKIGSSKIPLVTPFKTALRTVYVLESILVRIVTDDGMIGYGETAPTEAITGDSKESIVRSLEVLSHNIVGMDLTDKEHLLERLHESIDRNFNAKSAMEIALYDLWSQMAEVPLYRYLGGERDHFKTGITISLNPIEMMVNDALKAVEDGFGSLKIKLGDDPDKDILRIEAISQAVGESIALKLDANQGWSPDETVNFLADLEKREIEVQLIEQPVKREDFEGLKRIKEQSAVPILADESVFSPGDAKALLEMQAVDLINIKLDKCGGISRALEIADICEEYGVQCMIGCMLEGAISVGAAAHVASAKSQTITLFDLDAPMLCAKSIVQGGVLFDGADILLSKKPGLGIESIEDVVWYDIV